MSCSTFTVRIRDYLVMLCQKANKPQLGGGYMAPMGAVHWNYVKKLQTQMREQGLEVSVAVLNYTLTPHARFPGQLRQAVSALRHLVEKEKRSPSTVSKLYWKLDEV